MVRTLNLLQLTCPQIHFQSRTLLSGKLATASSGELRKQSWVWWKALEFMVCLSLYLDPKGMSKTNGLFGYYQRFRAIILHTFVGLGTTEKIKQKKIPSLALLLWTLGFKL